MSALVKSTSSDKRGAALILEIIIYLVIVALIAVAGTSGVRAIRDLVFASHAKGDLQVVQTWAEGKYIQDHAYPHNPVLITDPDVKLTTANGMTNTGKIASVNGAVAGYCIVVGSGTMSDPNKRWFWISSANPSNIMQSGTATNPNFIAAPPSGIPGVTCP